MPERIDRTNEPEGPSVASLWVQVLLQMMLRSRDDERERGGGPDVGPIICKKRGMRRAWRSERGREDERGRDVRPSRRAGKKDFEERQRGIIGGFGCEAGTTSSHARRRARYRATKPSGFLGSDEREGKLGER